VVEVTQSGKPNHSDRKLDSTLSPEPVAQNHCGGQHIMAWTEIQ
jgi:hypothetical protein